MSRNDTPTPRLRLRLSTVNIGTPDPKALAEFYGKLLGWPIGHEEDGFVVLRDPSGGVGLSFQREDGYVRPVWPAGHGDQQMQLHLEIQVDDLDDAREFALSSGAVLADFQPQDDVRVCLDPDGHPFCLWVEG